MQLGWRADWWPRFPCARRHFSGGCAKTSNHNRYRSLSLHLACDPLLEQRGHLQVILLEHHHMAVAMDSLVFQAPEGIGNAGLRQIPRGAMVVDRMIGGF